MTTVSEEREKEREEMSEEEVNEIMEKVDGFMRSELREQNLDVELWTQDEVEELKGVLKGKTSEELQGIVEEYAVNVMSTGNFLTIVGKLCGYVDEYIKRDILMGDGEILWTQREADKLVSRVKENVKKTRCLRNVREFYLTMVMVAGCACDVIIEFLLEKNIDFKLVDEKLLDNTLHILEYGLSKISVKPS
jgi:hypothetical protein